MFMLNETVSFALLLISLVFNNSRFRIFKYLILFFLFLALFNLPHFSYSTVSANTTTTHYSDTIKFFGVNPIVFLVILIFLMINQKLFSGLWTTIFYASDKEVQDKTAKEIDFYYEKFKSCPVDELRVLFKMYRDYPKAAQMALDKINQERELGLFKK